MRSSSGQHFIALDHLRALAAFLVVAWHFLHFSDGTPVPFDGAPAVFPLALVNEGHTGVALFMVLSGYLFAKLLDGKDIYYPAFFWNRFIRLAPLLFLTLAVVGLLKFMRGGSISEYAHNLVRGFVYPVWPNGGWSITTEIHFYLVLPLLFYLARHSKLLPLAVVAIAVCFRTYYFSERGQVQSIAYWTIAGRIDQFVLGIVAFYYSTELAKSRRFLICGFILFAAFWWWFDVSGGFYGRPSYPSPSSLWIWISTIEGMAYAALIVWYDSKTINVQSITARLLQRFGEYSYSIYLLHFFFVFKAANFVHTEIMDISNFYIAIIWAAIFFILMLVPGYLSFRYVESPFLKLRLSYIGRP